MRPFSSSAPPEALGFVLGTSSLKRMDKADPIHESVDSSNVGRVLASDAATFLKKSGLPDLILGKIWDLADTDAKGVLNKQEFFVALRLVACAQNGLDVSLSSLHLAVPPPRFRDQAAHCYSVDQHRPSSRGLSSPRRRPNTMQFLTALALWVAYCLVRR
ncbi:epidermal growth factor receptor substrate 15-like [Dromiciops gliroides]|uniref:epidermal growth factor receptor substrate 15-like n=1 Tax=Dromiciops gliroides TaxID=33562 RepID=UPI001CC7472D|nr:epidermal growth factor receptor substrate 15-like [Dromiciops gliroides]